MQINNKIKDCDDGKRRERNPEQVKKKIIHRITFAYDDVEPIPDRDLDGIAIANKFKETGKYRAGSYTGGQMPYNLILRTNGEIDQCCEVGDVSPHARRWNLEGLGLACVGDFTKHMPTIEQWNTLIEFGALCMQWGLTIHGHTELPGGTSDPSKACPGAKMDLDELRRLCLYQAEETGLNPYQAEKELTDLGIVF